MVQSREGLRFRQSGWGSRLARRVRPHGNGSGIGSRRPAAGSAAVRADRGRQKGADGRRTALGYFGRALAFAAIAASSACGSATTAPEAQLERSTAGLEQVPLTIKTGSGTHRFTGEVAASPEEEAQALMNGQSPAPDRGMIFARHAPGEAS